MRVTFFMPRREVVASADALDPEDPAAFRRGENVWILQTWLRLRRAGRPVELASEAPPDGLFVFHTKHRRQIRRLPGLPAQVRLVAIRADGSTPDFADFEILQNGRYADGVRRFAVPHWPQPGLVPREPGRGERVNVVSYKGFLDNPHPAFRKPDRETELQRRGLEWRVEVDWQDFRTTDVSLAIRPPDRRLHASKPASKLINTWHAGAARARVGLPRVAPGSRGLPGGPHSGGGARHARPAPRGPRLVPRLRRARPAPRRRVRRGRDGPALGDAPLRDHSRAGGRPDAAVPRALLGPHRAGSRPSGAAGSAAPLTALALLQHGLGVQMIVAAGLEVHRVGAREGFQPVQPDLEDPGRQPRDEPSGCRSN